MIIFIIIVICFILYGIISSKNKIYRIGVYGFFGIVFYLFISTSFHNIPFIPRYETVRIDTISPVMHNDLDDSEIIYTYSNDKYCIYYVESKIQKKGNLSFDEIKIPINIVDINYDDCEYPVALVKYTEFKPFWVFVLCINCPNVTYVNIKIPTKKETN